MLECPPSFLSEVTEGLLGARGLRELLKRHSIQPKKYLGQNFVIDPNTIRKVLESADVGASDDILEIGPGAGSLTLGLAGRARSVTAIEFDTRLMPVLEEVLDGASNVELINGDALEVELSGVRANKMVANLPYNIASAVVIRVLESAPQIEASTVMTQKEVGDRLVAVPGSKTYGIPTVLVSYFASARIAGRVSRRAFWPIPGVDSVIVSVVRNDELPDVPYLSVASVVRAAFSQRRKTVRNAIADFAGTTLEAEAALVAAGLDLSIRAEEMDLKDYLDLVRALAD